MEGINQILWSNFVVSILRKSFVLCRGGESEFGGCGREFAGKNGDFLIILNFKDKFATNQHNFKAGVTRVVIGIRHPSYHLRGKAIAAFRNEGMVVDVLGEDLHCKTVEEALKSCHLVNAPLLYRAACQVPFSVLKYAMTLDGKIAASSGHASWISSKMSRSRVFELRGRSDAVIVGGNNVRRDILALMN